MGDSKKESKTDSKKESQKESQEESKTARTKARKEARKQARKQERKKARKKARRHPNHTKINPKRHQNHVQGCKTSPKLIIGTPSPPKLHPSGHTGCHMKLQRASQDPTGKPKGAQKRSKGTLKTTKMEGNDSRGAKRGPCKNTKLNCNIT